MKRTSWLGWSGAVLLLCACGGVDDTGAGGSDPGASNPGTSNPGTPDTGVTPPPAPTTLTVTGRVLDPKGHPIDGAAVLIQGQRPVTTDASGAFSFSGVTPPYDLVAVSRTRLNVIVYQGVTRQDPTLRISDPSEFPVISATSMRGVISGAREPSDTVDSPGLMFVSPEDPTSQNFYIDSTNAYSQRVRWNDASTTTGTLFALQKERLSWNSSATKITAFGRRDNVSLQHDRDTHDQNVTLMPVASSSLVVNVTPPSGFELNTHSVGMRFAPSTTLWLWNSTSTISPFSYAMPVVAQSTFVVSASAKRPGSSATSMGTRSNVFAGLQNLSLPAPPTLRLPVPEANNVTRTSDFSWSGVAGGVYFVTFSWSSSGSLTVVTDQTHTALPDLSALALAMPTKVPISWGVQQHTPVDSVDFLLGSEGAWSGVPFGLDEYYVGTAAPRQFTLSSTP